MFIKNTYFIIALILLSQNVFASGNAGVGKIDYIYHRGSDGLVGVHKVGGNWNNPDNCQNSSKIVLTRDGLSRSELYSALLASKMSENDIDAYLVGCIDWNGVTYPVIYGVYTY